VPLPFIEAETARASVDAYARIMRRDDIERERGRASGRLLSMARDILEGDRFATEVRADESEAAQLGIRAVPCFVFAGRFGLSGAQPPEAIRQALDQA
jgi:protein disulfide-isomerase